MEADATKMTTVVGSAAGAQPEPSISADSITSETEARRGGELFFGLVGAVGTDLDQVQETLIETLREVDYDCASVHMIELLSELEEYKERLEIKPTYERYSSRMDAGNDFRKQVGRGDALAVLAVRKIRHQLRTDPKEPAERRAYIFRSLKTMDEVETLRRIYGPGFFVVAAHSPRTVRIENLSRRIARSPNPNQDGEPESLASNLVRRDEKEPDEYGQNVRDTFPLADVFVDASRPRIEIKHSIERFIALLFNYQFYTPYKDEYAMFHAYAAALRSAEMGRQVGAVLTSGDGEIIAVGTNEVPKFGGGLYWADDENDHRDFQEGIDANDEMKVRNLTEVINQLMGAGWLDPQVAKLPADERLAKAITVLKGTRLLSPIEYGRAVHAEMAAFMDASRRGVTVADATLYSTTFPCHNCTRHIVTSGVKRVVYIEPYAKSLGHELHRDSVSIDEGGRDNSVKFEPFVGVAPRQYLSLFKMEVRKTATGERVSWDKTRSFPRLTPAVTSYLENEDLEGEQLIELLKKYKLLDKD